METTASKKRIDVTTTTFRQNLKSLLEQINEEDVLVRVHQKAKCFVVLSEEEYNQLLSKRSFEGPYVAGEPYAVNKLLADGKEALHDPAKKIAGDPSLITYEYDD